MKRIIALAICLVVARPLVYAHNGNEHVRGVVTAISAKSITVQTAPEVTRTLTLSAQTTFKQDGKTAHLADLKVGDRVVVDVPEKTRQALLIRIGAATAAATAASTLTGVISDSMCGVSHKAMAGKKTDAECALACAQMGAQYALVSGGKVYKLTNHEADLKTHAGRTVQLTGELKGDTLKVVTIEMAKSETK